ncbi:MAG: acetone carboxylase subunit gamma, partial [Dehalococcoidia bacterium]|nr:acetone carboxylase subunit gamma [Dehalococcoidia bacterium]
STSPGFQLQRQLGGIRVATDEYDLLCYQIFMGCGYGDPLERDVRLIARDLENLVVSTETAVKIYGASFLKGTKQLDAQATETRRREMREERLGKAVALSPEIVAGRVHRQGETDKELLRIHEHLAIVRTTDGRKIITCVKCGNQFCDATDNYKKHALRWTRDVAEMKKMPPGEETYAYYQEYICPGCATLLQVDICYPSLDSDKPLWDIQIDASALD